MEEFLTNYVKNSAGDEISEWSACVCADRKSCCYFICDSGLSKLMDFSLFDGFCHFRDEDPGLLFLRYSIQVLEKI